MPFIDPDTQSGFIDPDSGQRKTPKQMREEPSAFDTLKQTIGAIGRYGPIPQLMRKASDVEAKLPYEVGGAVTDIHSRLPVTRAIAPELGFGANVATQYLMGGGMMPGSVAGKIPLKDIEKMGTLAAAQKLGLDVPPSMKGAGHIEKAIESIGGKADVAREMSANNREAIQIAARKAAGVAPQQPLNPETLAAARIPFYKPYNEIASISPRAKTALEQMRLAREEAKGFWREHQTQMTMASKKEAQRLDAKAEAYEKVIDMEAMKAGRPDLLPALQQARVALAKNADVERALIPGSGEIDARAVGRTLKKRGESGMTGELQTIGKFAQNFPEFVQPKAAATDVSALRPYASLLGLSVGAGAGGEYLGHKYAGTNYGYVMAALPFLSPAARTIALSRIMQSGALGPGASAGRIAGQGLIPLSQIGRPNEDARP